MTIYIDNMRARYGRMIMCHMGATTEKELFAIVDKIGIHRRWFQYSDFIIPHFDVCLSMRRRAIAAGAVEVTTKEFVKILKPIYSKEQHKK